MGWHSYCGGVRHTIVPANIYLASNDYISRYLFNPFTIATCLGRPTTAFTNSAIIYAISNAIAGRSVNSMLALGLASYLSVYPALLFPPLVLLCYDHYISKVKSGGSCVSYVASHSLIFVADIAGFLVISYGVTGYSWDFISATYGAHLLVPDLTPNAGLWWYFLIEIFDPFREFFLGVFWLHLASYVGGLTIRLRRQPLFVMTCLLGIFAIFKPYPGISDVSIYLSFLTLYRHIFPRMYFHIRCNLLNPLTRSSNALYLPLRLGFVICQSSGPDLLSPVDIRRFGKRQLLLCHHACMESWAFYPRCGLFIRCSQG